MGNDRYLKQTLHHLGTIYAEMGKAAGDISFVDTGRSVDKHFRHAVKTDALLCYLKGIKSISTLNACLVLLEDGYTQEIGALCRMVDDFCNEILFMIAPANGDEHSADQIRFMEDFYQEEFDQPANLFASTQKRATVRVQKVHSTIAKLARDELNPSDAQEVFRKIHQTFSGYIHGAYPHIMELYGGSPASFHLTGMLGTPRIPEYRSHIVGYVYGLIMVSIFVCRRLNVDYMEQPLRLLLQEFEQTTGSKSVFDAETLIKNLKENKRTQ